MNFVLNTISFFSTIIVVEGMVYFVLNLVFGEIKFLNSVLFKKPIIKTKHLIFWGIGIILIMLFSKIYLPY